MKLIAIFALCLMAAAVVAAAGPSNPDTEELKRLMQQQKRIHDLQNSATAQAAALQHDTMKLMDMQHKVSSADQKLLQKAEKIRVAQLKNAHAAQLLHHQQLMLAAKQHEAIRAQMQLQNLQQIISTLSNPALAELLPSPEQGIVANPALVRKLPHEKKKLEGPLHDGGFELHGEVTPTGKPTQEGPVLDITLHDDGSLSGQAFYKATSDHPKGLRIDVVGSWTSTGLRYVEVFEGKTFDFFGELSSDHQSVEGTYSFLPDGSGTFRFGIKELTLRAPNGEHVSRDYFKPHPSLDVAHDTLPLGAHFTPGFVKLNGQTTNSKSGKVTVSPSLLLSLNADGHLTGRTRYLADEHHKSTVVRLAGKWSDSSLSYAFDYHGKTYRFEGTLSENGNVKGEYHFGKTGHGKFVFVADRIMFHGEDLVNNPTPGTDPASNLEAEPIKAVPPGSVYNHYTGAVNLAAATRQAAANVEKLSRALSAEDLLKEQEEVAATGEGPAGGSADAGSSEESVDEDVNEVALEEALDAQKAEDEAEAQGIKMEPTL